MATHSDDDYINADPFSGDEAEITCRTVAIRTAAKEHTCYTLTGKQDHTIKRASGTGMSAPGSTAASGANTGSA